MDKKKQKRKIVLASTSPRRKELLGSTGLDFEAVASSYEEDMTLDLPPRELAKHLSRGKAETVAEKFEDAIVIAADTFISYNNKVLGKPHTPERAKEMLGALSGSVHSVITGFAIIDTKIGRLHSDYTETKIHFKTLSGDEIDAYVATGDPLDKAGAYGVQGLAAGFIDHMEGDYSNVVGLPVSDVMKVLEDFDIF